MRTENVDLCRILLSLPLCLSAVGCSSTAPQPCDPSAREAIVPVVADKFGQVIEIEGEFAPKRNTYFEQNVVTEPSLLKVLAVDGRQLRDPVLIEYAIENGSEIEREGRFRMRAYETIYTDGTPSGWGNLPDQFTYTIRHRAVIKDLRPTPH